MANTTVYPFGTGGSLPSSIGIINDLTTGGVDKALSAEQGKVLGGEINQLRQEVDLSQITTHSFGIAATNASAPWVQKGKHKVIPVTPGDLYGLLAQSTSTSAFFSFFTNEYEVPTDVSYPIYFITGWGRTSMVVGTEVFVEVPEGAAYLCINTVDGSSVSYTWAVTKVEYGLRHTVENNSAKIDSQESLLDIKTVDFSTKTLRASNIDASTLNWTAASTSRHYIFPVSAGDVFRLTACAWARSSYAFMTTMGYSANKAAPVVPNTGVNYVNPGATVTFVVPEDCYFMYIYAGNLTTWAKSNLPQSLTYYTPQRDNQRRAIKYKLHTSWKVDARTDSETFGGLLSGGSAYGTTGYIDLRGGKYVKYYANKTSADNDFYDITGTVFYDENRQPLTEGVRLMTYKSGSSTAGWILTSIPSGAAYMRVTAGSSLDGTISAYVYPLGDEDIYGLPDLHGELLKTLGFGFRGTKTQVSLIHCTDIHGDGDSWKRISDFATSIGATAVHTGDNVNYSWSSTAWDFLQTSGVSNILNCIGNHDGLKDGSWTGATPKEVYDVMIAPYVSNWGVTQPTDASDGKLYYYKDISTDVRLIVLDMHNISQSFTGASRAETVEGYTEAELTWFESVLADALTNSKTVVCASHYLFYSFSYDVNTAWDEGSEQPNWAKARTSTFGSISTAFVDAVSDFIDNGGKFVCWLGGHVHSSQFLHSGYDNRQLLICAANASLPAFAGSTHLRGNLDGYRDDFNFMRIYPNDGVLFVNRIGSNLAYLGLRQNMIVYDYINRELITTR